MSTPTDYRIAQAQRHARACARAGRPVTECPYPVDGDDTQRVLAMRWVRAYLGQQSQKPVTSGSTT